MKEILEYLYEHGTFSYEKAKEILTNMAAGSYNDAQVASFITAIIMRKITLEELKGFRDGLKELSTQVDLSAYRPMDVCGTGGDGKNTFNISTLSAFVVAACGIPVAKHGNYGVSSVSGSSNVLEHLGMRFQTDPQLIEQQLKETNLCFLHAPLFHPAMKSVAPVRKQLGVKTFFNMLGPLVNPASPTVQLVGVFNLELARLYHYLFQAEEMQFSIIHGHNGFDEVSLTDTCRIISNDEELDIEPSYFSYDYLKEEQLKGGDTVASSAQLFMHILNAKGTEAQNSVVIANSALAIKTYFPKLSIQEAKEQAETALLGKKALEVFHQLKKLS